MCGEEIHGNFGQHVENVDVVVQMKNKLWWDMNMNWGEWDLRLVKWIIDKFKAYWKFLSFDWNTHEVLNFNSLKVKF